jgi:hypothetical protein
MSVRIWFPCPPDGATGTEKWHVLVEGQESKLTFLETESSHMIRTELLARSRSAGNVCRFKLAENDKRKVSLTTSSGSGKLRSKMPASDCKVSTGFALSRIPKQQKSKSIEVAGKSNIAVFILLGGADRLIKNRYTDAVSCLNNMLDL